MGRLLALLVLVALSLTASPARGGYDVGGVIQAGNPMTAVVGGVTEIMGACDPTSDVQGVDGYWLKLPADAATKRATLTIRDVDDDVDLYFYDGDCSFVDDLSMAQKSFGETEHGNIPEGATWAVANLYLGADAGFTVSVD